MKVGDFLQEKFRDMGFEEEMSQETILDLNLTSLEKVDLLLSIQEEYGIEVKLSELDNMHITPPTCLIIFYVEIF